jgi:hypothetical protein
MLKLKIRREVEESSESLTDFEKGAVIRIGAAYYQKVRTVNKLLAYLEENGETALVKWVRKNPTQSRRWLLRGIH